MENIEKCEYINKQRILEKAKQLQGGSFATPLIIEAIENAEVVEVVKCSECKYYPLWSNGSEMHYCDLHERHAYGDDFCSYGEKRDT